MEEVPLTYSLAVMDWLPNLQLYWFIMRWAGIELPSVSQPLPPIKPFYEFLWLPFVVWSNPFALDLPLVFLAILLLPLCFLRSNHFRNTTPANGNAHAASRLAGLKERLDTLFNKFEDFRSSADDAAEKPAELATTVNGNISGQIDRILEALPGYEQQFDDLQEKVSLSSLGSSQKLRVD